MTGENMRQSTADNTLSAVEDGQSRHKPRYSTLMHTAQHYALYVHSSPQNLPPICTRMALGSAASESLSAVRSLWYCDHTHQTPQSQVGIPTCMWTTRVQSSVAALTLDTMTIMRMKMVSRWTRKRIALRKHRL